MTDVLPRQRGSDLEAPERILLCLEPSHLGEFYYPLAPGETATCPYDGEHPVRVYRVEEGY